MSELFGKLSEVVISGNIEECEKLAQEALDEGSLVGYLGKRPDFRDGYSGPAV
ncbi:MAG TPA: hypothetical protein VMW09_01975 [Desulfatiglandales bacterium]|nr:hypothetical protein [Desulfatiglandales bacterium]